ncbi:MAG: diguanylate cyclase [Spirochaetales bacterium]
MQFLKSPFFRRIILVFSLVIFLGFGTLTYWAARSVRQSFRNLQLATLTDIAREFKHRVQAWLGEKQKNIQSLAKMLEGYPESHVNVLSKFREVYREFADVILLSKDGIIQATAGGGASFSLNLSDREYFQYALAGNSFVSGFFRGRSVGISTLSISAPVYRQGKVDRVLAGFITLPTFLRVFSSMYDSSLNSPTAFTVKFINSKGQVISNPEYIRRYPLDPNIEEDPSFVSSSVPVKNLLNGKEGATLYQDQEVGKYAAYTWLAPLQVGIVVEARQDALEDPLDRQLLALVTASLSVFVVLAILLILTFWYLTRPLSELLDAMDRLIHNQPRSHLKTLRTGSQIDQVIEKFNQLRQIIDQREGELKEKAARDSLTGLYNHGTLKELLQKEIARRKRSGNPLCFLMADIDHFKALNDNFGHAAGDYVLKKVSEIIRSCVREGDIVARYGGEEFAVLLDSDNPEAASILAERIRSRVGAYQFVYNNQSLPVTISVGWSCVPSKEITSVTDLIKTSDQALYRAKELGRNRVEGN